MHSFYELNSYLKDDKFCLTTVDTIFREEEFSTFIEAFKQSDKDGYMAVTDFIDDEKPLYISTDEALNITGFHDEAISGCRYISGGIYCLNSDSGQDIARVYGKRYVPYAQLPEAVSGRRLEIKGLSFYKNSGCRPCQ